MADISKCSAKLCDRAESCYRKTATDSYLQSWTDFSAGKYYKALGGVVGKSDIGYMFWDNLVGKYLCRFFIDNKDVAK